MCERFTNSLYSAAVVLFLIVASNATAVAQGNGSPTAGNGSAAVGAARSVKMPFAEGESITYEGKLKRLLLTISVGEMTFTVGPQIGTSAFSVNAEAVSKGTLLKLLRFSFLQRFDSTIDATDFKALKTVKHDVQKDRIRDSEAVFNYGESKVTYVETDPNNPSNPPRTIASDLPGGTHDIVSALYSLRLQPLAIGKTFDVTLSDSGLVYQVPVTVVGRERERTSLGRVWCYKLEAGIFGPGRLIEQDGSMTIWITEDTRRIPVRALVDTSVGKLDIRVSSARNIGPLPARR